MNTLFPLPPEVKKATEPPTEKPKKQWFIVFVDSDGSEYFYWKSHDSFTAGIIPIGELGKPRKPKRWKRRLVALAHADFLRDNKDGMSTEAREWVE